MPDEEKDIKIFLFDFEGVLVPKELSDNVSMLEKNCKIVKEFFRELHSKGFYSGIVTMRNDESLFGQFNEVPDCRIIISSIDKVSPVQKLLNELKLSFDQLFYIGDDILDIPLLNKAGISAAPSIAHKEVKRIVKFVIPYLVINDLFEFIKKQIIRK